METKGRLLDVFFSLILITWIFVYLFICQNNNHVVTVPAGSAQQAQIIQTSDGQAIVYPIQVDSQGNILHQQSTGN